MAVDSPSIVSMCQQHADTQPAQLQYRASSVPMPGIPARLPSLHLGRFIGRGSFGRVYRGTLVDLMLHLLSSCTPLRFKYEAAEVVLVIFERKS